MRTNNKQLTPQAHAASQVNVKPTKKANSSTVVNNQKKPPARRPAKDFDGGTTYRKNPLYAEGILLNDYNRKFIAGNDFKDWPNVDLAKLPQALIDQIIRNHFPIIESNSQTEYFGYLINRLNEQNTTIQALKKDLESKDTKHSAEQTVKGEKSQAPAEPAGKLKYEFLQLHKRDSREYSKQNINNMPPNVFISRFEDNILTDFQIGSTSNYHAAFIELSTDISILWENMTLYKLPQSFYHIAESMQYLTRLQFFLKHCIENEYFDKEENPNKKFHHQFCFWGLGDETFEQVLKGISESYIIVKNALYTVWGKDNEMHDFLNFFSLLYNFYSSCNDYLLNPENN